MLKGDNDRTVLVDVGFLDDSIKLREYDIEDYQRPDLALQRLNVAAGDVTDVVITHPHWDHIGGLSLFGKATI